MNCQYKLNDEPCGAPIIIDTSSYSGWSHEYQFAHGQKIDWLHWASPIPYGPQDSVSSFVSCAICGKTGPENKAHIRYDGHRFACDPEKLEHEVGEPAPGLAMPPRLELEQEYGEDHPWPQFDVWHKEFHEIADGGPIAWPCRQPLRCFWRWTRKTGTTLNQNGILPPATAAQSGVERAQALLEKFVEAAIREKLECSEKREDPERR